VGPPRGKMVDPKEDLGKNAEKAKRAPPNITGLGKKPPRENPKKGPSKKRLNPQCPTRGKAPTGPANVPIYPVITPFKKVENPTSLGLP